MSPSRVSLIRAQLGRTVTVIASSVALLAGLLVAPAATAAPAGPVDTALSANALGSPVKTADLSQFRPGNIISDEVFYNSGTMSEAQIQTFLQSKVPSCQSGYTCLKDWYDTTRATNADAMCAAYPGGGRERASTIIYRVAQACGINPQAILVTLQKEQGLVTHTWPSTSRYTIAMGQGCPDTAACDTRYYGFFNQVYGAAWQLKRYGNPPGTSQYFTWYAPGKTWNVRFHPNAACGSTPVYIQNKATAALYYYTPYQPNAAALAAGYAAANDPCSSYGNRNFYNYFTDWFGSVQGEMLQLLQVSGTSERYIVSMGGRWKLATAEIAAQFQWISALREVTRAQLDAFQDRGNAARAVRTDSGAVYLLDSGARLRARDVNQVADFGWDYGALPLASDGQVARYRDGGWLERTVSADGQSYLIQGGSKRQVVDLGILPRFGIPALSSSISPTMLSGYATAAPVVGVGVYRGSSADFRLRTDAGTYLLPAAAGDTALARGASRLTDESLAFLRASENMPVRMTSSGRSFVMSEDGWIEVAVSDYPASLGFASLPAGAASGLASAGRVSGPHFIRERSSDQAYLVSGGTVQAVSSADQAWITRTYGVGSRVWIVLDGVIGEATTPEGLVRSTSGDAYLLDGARAYRMRDCAQVAAWGGNCASLPLVANAKINGYANVGTLRDLVRTPAGTTWLPQNGVMRQVLDPAILAVYGISSAPSAVSAATADKLPVGEPVLATGVYSDGGAGRIVANRAGEFTLTAEQAVGVVAGSVRALTRASFTKITVDGAMPTRLRSDGRSFVLTREGWLEVSAAAYGGDGLFAALSSQAHQGIVVAANEQRPHFIRDDASGQEYLVSSGAAQPVAGAAERALITRAYGVPPQVWPVVSGALSGVKINHDMVVKDAQGAVYLIDGATRYKMSGCGAVPDFGRDCATLRVLSASQIAALTDGGSLAPLLRSPEGYAWLIQGGTRREVPDTSVLAVYGIGGATTSVSAKLIAGIRLGAPVVAPGVYDDRAGDVRVLTGDGVTFTVPAASRIGSVVAAARTMSPASIDLLTAPRDLPTRMTAGAQSYVFTTEGWLAVDKTAYTPNTFMALGPRANLGLPSAGTAGGAHFVREQSDTQVYLASGGLGAVADEATRAWISAAYGVPSKVWVVPNGTLG
ncbi:hypothetical protein [Microbacterium sp. SLBN-146]|uniref:hypothetical protein n=1 Tax=Microbacterium sp. SLBN-146 TaxID=2768457 RepID=UPI001151A61E|nr:hypothetical protein [Microbacterium sp. SLBN-146]TQJ32737.1 hypothetical protein FBY39_3251 [Microbacterium sp. SLBN-146]